MPRTVTVGTGTGEGDLVDKLGLSEAPGTRGLAGQGFWPGDLDSWPTVCKGAAGSGPRLGLRRAGLCRAWQWERALVSVGHRARVGGIGRCTRGRKCKGPVTGVGRLGLPRGDTPEHRPWPWRGLGWSVEPGRRPRPSPAQGSGWGSSPCGRRGLESAVAPACPGACSGGHGPLQSGWAQRSGPAGDRAYLSLASASVTWALPGGWARGASRPGPDRPDLALRSPCPEPGSAGRQEDSWPAPCAGPEEGTDPQLLGQRWRQR